MPSWTPNPADVAAVVATVDPDANAAGAHTSDEVDMSKFDNLMWIVQAGELGSSAGLAFKLQESDSSGGTFTDITGKAITQLTDAATDSDKQAIVTVRSDELADGNRFVRGIMTITTATSDSAVICLGFFPRHGPASDSDLASVAEIVTT